MKMVENSPMFPKFLRFPKLSQFLQIPQVPKVPKVPKVPQDPGALKLADGRRPSTKFMGEEIFFSLSSFSSKRTLWIVDCIGLGANLGKIKIMKQKES